MFRDFLRVFDAEEFADDERFQTPRGRATHRAELRESWSKTSCAHGTCADWIEAFNEVGVPCGPVLTIDQVFADPQVQYLRPGPAGRKPALRASDARALARTRLSRTSTSLRSAAPLPGGDTAAVLGEYGYTAAEIAALSASGAITTPS